MNRKEVAELRRRWQMDKNAVGHIYGCYVNPEKNIVSELDVSLTMLQREEAEKYLALMKKSMSGRLGKNLIDIVFSTQQVMESDEHRLLTALRSSKLHDADARRAFYEKVAGSLTLEETGYLLLLGCDTYDVPHKGKDGAVLEDASDTMFTYLLCCICPVKDAKAELGYFPGENAFRYTATRLVAAPELGFLFPAFDDRAANIYNALYYAHKPDELHQELIDAVFHTDPPMSASEQRDAFRSALEEAMDGACTLEVACSLQDVVFDKLQIHKESGDPEPLTMTAGDMGRVLSDCGVEDEQVRTFTQRCDEEYGKGALLDPLNLIETGKMEIKTAHATVSVEPQNSALLETRIIEGRRYLLVPAEDVVELNGMAVHMEEKR